VNIEGALYPALEENKKRIHKNLDVWFPKRNHPLHHHTRRIRRLLRQQNLLESIHFPLGQSCWFGIQLSATGTMCQKFDGSSVCPLTQTQHYVQQGEFWNMKKLLTLLFVAAMAISMSSMSFAQDTSGTMDKKETKAEKKAAKKEKKEKKKAAKEEKKDETKKQ